jgi:hypothetical protein
MKDNLLLIKPYFEMMHRVLNVCPNVLLPTALLPSVLQLAIACIPVSEQGMYYCCLLTLTGTIITDRDTGKILVNFIDSLLFGLPHSSFSQIIDNQLQLYGQLLVTTIFHVCYYSLLLVTTIFHVCIHFS